MGDSTRADNSGFRNNVRNYLDLAIKGRIEPENYDKTSGWQTEVMLEQSRKNRARVRAWLGQKTGRTVEVVDTAAPAEAKKPGIAVRAALFVYSAIERLFSSEKNLENTMYLRV